MIDRGTLKRTAKRIRPVRILYGKVWALTHYWPSMLKNPNAAINFLLRDPELDNYTYELDNFPELVAFLAGALQVPNETMSGYLRELETDNPLRAELAERLRSHPDRKPV